MYHSVVWPYFGAETQDAIRRTFDDAGRSVTPDAPLAWLRLEPHADNFIPAELCLTVRDGSSDGGREALLATTGFHGGPLAWLGGA